MKPLTARPLQAFRLGTKKIVVCQLADEDPTQFLHQELNFYSHGKLAGRITLVGVSTASDYKQRIFDFSYVGDEILKQHLNDECITTGDEHKFSASQEREREL